MSALLRALGGVLCAVVILGNSQAVAQKRRTIKMPDQIIQQLMNESESVRKCFESSGGVNRTFKTESIDLSKDKSVEIMVRGISPCVCTPRKCINRIYRQTDDGYELLFEADYAQEIELQKEYKNGYRNLWAAVYVFHSYTSVLFEYQYNGEQYKWDHCLMRFHFHRETVGGVPFSGRLRYHRLPAISWVGCNQLNPYGPM